nr:hypothetical protein [Candidatus Woesebacteria bacterium]
MYDELNLVLNYIIDAIAENELVQRHNELAQLYETARTAPTPEVTAQILAKQKEIRTAQDEIEPQGWDTIRIKVFEQFGATSVLGKRGDARLQKELNQFSNDPHGASQTATRFSSEITAVQSRAQQAISGLGSLLEDPEKLPEGKQMVQLVFDEFVAIDEFDELVHQAHEWDVILKSLKHLLPEPDEEAHLYKIQKSSPVIIIVVAGVPLIFAILKITKEVLDIVEKLWTIRKLKAETKAAEFDGELKQKMIDNLTEAEEKKLDGLVEEKVKSIMDDYRPKLSDTQANQAETAVRYNIKKIYNFTVQGGAVNIIDDEVEEGEETLEQAEFAPTYAKNKELLKTNGETLLLAKFERKEEETAEQLAENEVKTAPKKSVARAKSAGKSSEAETPTEEK